VAAGGWRADDYAAAWSALLRLHAEVVPALDDGLQRATGLPLRWYDVLLELSAAPEGRMRMSDLGATVVLSRTRVSRVVDELTAEGLVRRVPNPEDGRSAYAAVTKEGTKAFRRAAPVYLELIRSHLAGRLGAREVQQLRRILEGALAASSTTA
jgi:DNA-binding MarR family transcriptional regulator